MIDSILEGYSSFGFSGSRYTSKPSRGMIEIADLLSVRSVSVFVGCQRGVDSFFREIFPDASVFRPTFQGKGGYAVRSASCVDSTRRARGLWISFPKGACPSLLRPSCRTRTAFNGSGSGTWASLAYAVGSGTDVLVFSPTVPDWGFTEVDSYWWLLVNKCEQMTLF